MMFAFGAALSASFDWKMSGFRATWLEVTLADLLMTCTGLLLIWNSQDFTKSARPVPKLHRALAVAAASFVGLNFLMRDYLPHTWSMERAGGMAGQQFALALCMVGFGRAYLRSDVLERRQIRWVLLGFYVNWVGIAFSTASSYFFPHTFARMVGSFSDLGVPVGILVSVLGYRWLDVDRLISAAASYTILGLAVLGTALAVLPAAAQVAAPVLGIASPTLQWLLTMALVLAAIPAHAFLWPRVDRRMFRERHQRMLGFARLLDEIGSYASAEDLVCLAGKRLNALLEPESLAVYVRADRHFAALLTLGRAKPEAPFERDSLLLRALGQRGRPLWADAAELSAFDRAALETVAVELIVPIRGRDELLAFVCLGRKRSGDIYTPQEVAHLGAVANRCAEILLRLTPEPEAEPARHVFHRDGDFWTIASGGKEIRLRDMRGLHYLATLLREPGREFAATDLVRLANGRPGVPVTDGLGDAGPIDARARAACRERLLEIEAERAEAERNGDLGRLERTLDEREALLAELMSASRDRRPASHSERARVAVTKAIKAAIERIAERHPELAADLSVWIHRGSLCSYVPEPRASTPWET
ncbi:MAG TPA: hypothetical protein VEI82_00115 [Myxococcota bacterium]|nr:hypothetical protein [Myxococcota bacterium]